MTSLQSKTIQRRVRVSGRVQGVCFRASTEAETTNYPGILGWVKNLSDGRVEAVFQGPEDAVLSLVAWCRKGPESARVETLEVFDEDLDGGLGPFEVRS